MKSTRAWGNKIDRKCWISIQVVVARAWHTECSGYFRSHNWGVVQTPEQWSEWKRFTRKVGGTPFTWMPLSHIHSNLIKWLLCTDTIIGYRDTFSFNESNIPKRWGFHFEGLLETKIWQYHIGIHPIHNGLTFKVLELF